MDSCLAAYIDSLKPADVEYIANLLGDIELDDVEFELCGPSDRNGEQ